MIGKPPSNSFQILSGFRDIWLMGSTTEVKAEDRTTAAAGVVRGGGYALPMFRASKVPMSTMQGELRLWG